MSPGGDLPSKSALWGFLNTPHARFTHIGFSEEERLLNEMVDVPNRWILHQEVKAGWVVTGQYWKADTASNTFKLSI